MSPRSKRSIAMHDINEDARARKPFDRISTARPPNGGLTGSLSSPVFGKPSSPDDSFVCFVSRDNPPKAKADTLCRFCRPWPDGLEGSSAEPLTAIISPRAGDHFRRGKCGKHRRSADSIARQRERLRAFWSDPENRRRQSEKTIARMAAPAVRQRISKATAAAMAKPYVKARQVAGLKQRYFDDPGLRQRVSEATKAGMRRWRERRIQAAATVLQQLPKAELAAALAVLNGAAGSSRRRQPWTNPLAGTWLAVTAQPFWATNSTPSELRTEPNDITDSDSRQDT
jgi:hypothetical protein